MMTPKELVSDVMTIIYNVIFRFPIFTRYFEPSGGQNLADYQISNLHLRQLFIFRKLLISVKYWYFAIKTSNISKHLGNDMYVLRK